MNPRTTKTPTTLNSMPYLYLGLTDYVQLEREARRARARVIALGLKRAWTKLFGPSKPAAKVADFSRDDLLALGVPAKDVRIALAGQSLGNLIASATAYFAALWQRAAAEAELRGLDDRTLHDMGLSRSDIPAAVAGEMYRGEQPSNENTGVAKVQALKQKEVVAA